MRYLALLLFLICGSATAHQWTPSHVELRPSYVSGIHTATMKFYNSRDDVEYYQVQVFDGQFNPIKFAIQGGSNSDVIHARHRQYKTVDVYVPSYEAVRVVYICTRSMILKKFETASLVSSRICSKVINE